MTLFIIQIGSFLLYCIAFYALNYSKQHDNPYVIIKRKLQKTYKSPENWVWCIIVILYVLAFGSAIFTWIETYVTQTKPDTLSLYQAKDNDALWVRAVMQIILYVLDIFKWLQITMISWIIYGFLNTFSDQIYNFESQLALKMQQTEYQKYAEHRGNLNNVSGISAVTTAFRPDNNPNPLISFNKLDHGIFMMDYNTMTDKFKHVLSIFQIFITMFGVFNIIVWSLLVWTVSETFYADSSVCGYNGIYPFYIHHATEIALYFALWFIILYKFNRNHSMIEEYKIKCQTRVVPKEKDERLNSNDFDRKREIISFLESQLGNNSPFVVFGCITPTISKGVGLFTSFLIPITVGIVEYGKDYII